MGIRVAVASSDGIVVNQHFGKADHFLIYEETTDQVFVRKERRAVAPICLDWAHEEINLTETANLLSDCDCVLVSKIGREADLVLRCRNIQSFLITDYIDSALITLTNYLRENANKIQV